MKKLDESHQCAPAAQESNCILGCIKREVSIRVREEIVLIYFAPYDSMILW